MLLALAGITGVGKSFFIDKLKEELNFEKVRTIRTRKIRKNEVNGKDGIFLTKEELENYKKDGKIVYEYEVFGGSYAYLKEDIFTEKNMAFEMHYTMIDDWKKIRPDIKTIYFFSEDMNMTINQLKKRNMDKDKEIERLNEISEQHRLIKESQEWKNKFDYILYNNYNEESVEEFINVVKEIIEMERTDERKAL